MILQNVTNKAALKTYLGATKGKKLIQLHHTYSPSQADSMGRTPESMQQAMRNYHVNTRHFADIAQHFTVFAGGTILTGRPLDKDPAGIYGANHKAICIECVGNFDSEKPTKEQEQSIVMLLKTLLKHYNLDPAKAIVYHCWYTAKGEKIGTYRRDKSCKTCPGTNFFGGNTRTSFEKNLLPLLKEDDTMTQSDFNRMLDKYLAERRKANVSPWAATVWDDAIKRGITDGTRPLDYATREEVIKLIYEYFGGKNGN